MKQLLHILDQVPEFQQLLDALDAGRSPAAVSGLSPVHRAHFAAGIRRHWDCPVVMVCADEEEGRRLAADLTAFTGEEVTLLAAREFLFHDSAVASRQWEHRRLAAFHAMARGQAPLIVATVEGLLQRTLSPEELAEHTVTIENGGQYDLDRLADQLSALGYTRCEQVEGVGQFALRGGILDVYSPAQDHPVRIEFWDTDVDSMGLFDVNTQRRVEVICPVYATHTKARLNHILDILLRDTVKARALDSEGSYQKKVPAPGAPGLSSQDFFMDEAVRSCREVEFAARALPSGPLGGLLRRLRRRG